LERIILIHQAVEARSYPNATTLAADLGVSAKTTARDIEYMKHRLRLALKYDSVRHGYCYAHPVPPGAMHPVSEADLFNLMVVALIVPFCHSTAFGSDFRSALEEMLLSMEPLKFRLLSDFRSPMSQPMLSPDPESVKKLAAPGFSA
jgi:hypothetical protein